MGASIYGEPEPWCWPGILPGGRLASIPPSSRRPSGSIPACAGEPYDKGYYHSYLEETLHAQLPDTDSQDLNPNTGNSPGRRDPAPRPLLSRLGHRPCAYRRLVVAAALQLSRLVRHHAKSKPFLQERIDPGSPGDCQQYPQLCIYDIMHLHCCVIAISFYIMKNDSSTQLVRGCHSGWPPHPLP